MGCACSGSLIPVPIATMRASVSVCGINLVQWKISAMKYLGWKPPLDPLSAHCVLHLMCHQSWKSKEVRAGTKSMEMIWIIVVHFICSQAIYVVEREQLKFCYSLSSAPLCDLFFIGCCLNKSIYAVASFNRILIRNTRCYFWQQMRSCLLAFSFLWCCWAVQKILCANQIAPSLHHCNDAHIHT